MTQKTILESYPKETQDAVKDMLGAYREINVITNNGIHEVSTGAGLTASYANDYRIETFNASEILTEKEIMIGYIESFHEYPKNYEGERNLKWLESLEWETKLKIDERGNITLA